MNKEEKGVQERENEAREKEGKNKKFSLLFCVGFCSRNREKATQVKSMGYKFFDTLIIYYHDANKLRFHLMAKEL